MASSDPPKRPRPGPWPPAPESTAIAPSSWAKRTGFRPKFSGEAHTPPDSGQIAPQPNKPDPTPDLESGRPAAPPAAANGGHEKEKPPPLPPSRRAAEEVKKRRESDGGGGGRKSSEAPTANGQVTGAEAAAVPPPGRRAARNNDVDGLPQVVDDDGFGSRHSHMKYELRDKPGLGELYFVTFID